MTEKNSRDAVCLLCEPVTNTFGVVVSVEHASTIDRGVASSTSSSSWTQTRAWSELHDVKGLHFFLWLDPIERVGSDVGLCRVLGKADGGSEGRRRGQRE
jgi:hypothetical protein